MPIADDILKDETLVFLDLETTGLNFHTDKIIEIGAVKTRNGVALEKFHRLINPKIPLAFFITHLTGIKQQDLLDKSSIEEISGELFSFLDEHPIICHNVSFERTFLTVIKGAAPKNIFMDTCELAALLYPVLVSYKLEKLLEFFKIKNKEAHRALTDAEDTFKLWQALFVNLGESDFERIRDMNNIFSTTDLPLKKVFGDLTKLLSAETRREDVVPTEIKTDKESREWKINETVLDEVFKTGGGLSQAFDGYEVRQEQMLVSKAVTKAFKENKYLAVEAGTGVGKSLGYLLPAAFFAVETKEKIVVSTNTKNLQDQLAGKDIPLAAAALKADLKTAVVKGRDNYLCLKKLDDLIVNLEKKNDETKFALAYLVSFKYKTPQGQLDEVSPYLLKTNSALQDIVNFLACEDSVCLKNKCFHRGGCFFQRMIKRAREADIIIANHSLIFSKPEWFPQYSRLIMDEAHNIEDAATSAFTETASLKELELLMSDLTARKLRLSAIKKKDLEAADVKILEQRVSKAKESVGKFSAELISFFGPDEMRFGENIITVDFSEIEKSRNFESLRKNCLEVISLLEQIIETLFVVSSSPRFNFEDRLKIDGFAQKLEDKVLVLRQLISPDDKKIKWIEFSRVDEGARRFPLKARGENKQALVWKFFCAPLEVSSVLAQDIYSPLKSVVFISAVLKVAGSFSFFSEQSGLSLLDSRRVFFETIGSPFDFNKSVILGIPKNFPTYEHNNEERYLGALADGILKLVISVRGRSLALFSSKKRMKEIYQRVKNTVEKEGILTLCQDLDGTRQSLVSRLRDDKKDMLVFGSKSFQEGVDASGLSCIYIDKLSFPHRLDPIISARRNYLLKRGKNPFKEYELPLAIIALKQGFGRLIRKNSDFGLVAIFDSRLLERDYKEVVLKSLPKVELVSLEGEEFFTVLKRKFEEIKRGKL